MADHRRLAIGDRAIEKPSDHRCAASRHRSSQGVEIIGHRRASRPMKRCSMSFDNRCGDIDIR